MSSRSPGRFIVLLFLATVPIALCVSLLGGCLGPGAGESSTAADNSYCMVCHLNYAHDPFAQAHEKEGIGCIKCHGASLPHSEDEAAVVAPDRMFSRQAVNPACAMCHGLLGGSDECEIAAEGRICTDCHDSHRLAVRERVWDKRTGKLLSAADGESDGMGDM